MGWIGLVIFLAILAAIIITAVITSHYHNKGDYKDGGGTFLGGSNESSFFDPANEVAGVKGEQIVIHYLRPLLRKDEYLLANLLIPLRNGDKTEIDCVLVSRKGIFCIETKKWVGHIYGRDEDEYWLQQYDDPSMTDKRHKNPVMQNKNHCSILSRFLFDKYLINNVVIFADLEAVCGIESRYTYSIYEFRKVYRQLPDSVLSVEQVKGIAEYLSEFIGSYKDLKEHKENIRRKYN